MFRLRLRIVNIIGSGQATELYLGHIPPPNNVTFCLAFVNFIFRRGRWHLRRRYVIVAVIVSPPVFKLPLMTVNY
jgi:hypothetical protein